ncbi:hypothetical protein PpBr36_04034 [Pyricularia pennisetigena]|uniref:hypothetical protein n=1 Tax=Pyricularia pennisetigena TaxID=1578925 RepID=UPI00114E8B23|nr:hypothetical protein PpBr36_04034 [Pyricularia pennisetigena]TLS26657.1 hypothetical protein PpBr36_04034 [Pyricularia pennisetigena]
MLLTVFLATTLAQQAFCQQNNANPKCYYPSGKLHEKGVPCHSSGVSTCCEASQTCLSNGLCYNTGSNTLNRYSCTDKDWTSELCPKFCEAASREAPIEIRRCSGSSDLWICGSRSDECGKGNFTLPMGQVADGRAFSENGVLQAGTCIADAPSSGAQQGGGSGGRPGGPPPWITAACGATTVTTTATVTADADSVAAVAAGQLEEERRKSQEKVVAVGVGVGVGVSVPLLAALAGMIFLLIRVRKAAAAAKAALADVQGQRNRHHHGSELPSHAEDPNAVSSPHILSSLPLYGMTPAMEKHHRRVHEAGSLPFISQLGARPEETNVVHEAPSGSPTVVSITPLSAGTSPVNVVSPDSVHTQKVLFEPGARNHRLR